MMDDDDNDDDDLLHTLEHKPKGTFQPSNHKFLGLTL